MTQINVFSNHRLLLYYKGDISALILFAQRNGSICFPEPLPALSSALEPEEFVTGKVSTHPASLVNNINQLLQLDNDILRASCCSIRRIY
jgi:hypothetical protein